MRSVFIIAKNTYLEIIRDRILYGLIVFAILLIGLSLALGQLTFAEQARITADFGFSAIHISAAILSIFVGSTLVAREIDKKTILTLLARPISRSQFLVGKYFGLYAVIVVATLLLAAVLSALLLLMGMDMSLAFVAGLYGVLLEASVLLSATLFFGSFASSMLSSAFVLAIFLTGHWVESLKFFSENSQSASFILMSKVIRNIVPNLENFNWRSLFVYNDLLPLNDLAFGSLYSLAWSVFFITLSALIISRRDLG